MDIKRVIREEGLKRYPVDYPKIGIGG